MKLKTTSEVISLVKNLEELSSKYYQDLIDRYSQEDELFSSFIKENTKNATHIQRTYYSVISDALEGCFAFDLDASNYDLDLELAQDASYDEALEKALQIEETINKFYDQAEEQSRSVMADVPRAFKMVSKKKNKRIACIRDMVNKRQ